MRPLVLLTNDDGIMSPGLRAAAEVAGELAEIIIAAPHTQQTGMGRAFPVLKENGKIEERMLNIGGKEVRAYAVHGSPALAVAHGILELADRKPDLCISGINYGENIGTTLTCSGTLGAAFEAVTHGVPGLAISMGAEIGEHRSNEFKGMDWSAATELLRLWLAQVLDKGMPPDTDIWNLNIPIHAKAPCPYRITTQSRQNYFDFIKPEERAYQEPYSLESRRYVDLARLEKSSDIYALYVDHIASVTPICTDMSRGLTESNIF